MTPFLPLLLLLLQILPFAQSAVLHPMLRMVAAKGPTEKEEAENTRAPATKWHGEEAEEVIRELMEIMEERARRQAEAEAIAKNGSLFDRIKAFFTGNPATELGQTNGELNNCFFTPMNCKIAASAAAAARGRGATILVITEEERERLMAGMQQKQKQRKKKQKQQLEEGEEEGTKRGGGRRRGRQRAVKRMQQL